MNTDNLESVLRGLSKPYNEIDSVLERILPFKDKSVSNSGNQMGGWVFDLLNQNVVYQNVVEEEEEEVILDEIDKIDEKKEEK